MLEIFYRANIVTINILLNLVNFNIELYYSIIRIFIYILIVNKLNSTADLYINIYLIFLAQIKTIRNYLLIANKYSFLNLKNNKYLYKYYYSTST